MHVSNLINSILIVHTKWFKASLVAIKHLVIPRNVCVLWFSREQQKARIKITIMNKTNNLKLRVVKVIKADSNVHKDTL